MMSIQQWKDKKLADFEIKREISEKEWIEAALDWVESVLPEERGEVLEFKPRN